MFDAFLQLLIFPANQIVEQGNEQNDKKKQTAHKNQLIWNADDGQKLLLQQLQLLFGFVFV